MCFVAVFEVDHLGIHFLDISWPPFLLEASHSLAGHDDDEGAPKCWISHPKTWGSQQKTLKWYCMKFANTQRPRKEANDFIKWLKSAQIDSCWKNEAHPIVLLNSNHFQPLQVCPQMESFRWEVSIAHLHDDYRWGIGPFMHWELS